MLLGWGFCTIAEAEQWLQIPDYNVHNCIYGIFLILLGFLIAYVLDGFTVVFFGAVGTYFIGIFWIEDIWR